MTFFLPVVEASLVHARPTWANRMRWIMRVSFVYVLLIIISGSLVQAHASFGQVLDQRVTVGMDNEPLKVLFRRLEQQTGLSYAFSTDDARKLSFPEEERTLKETLELALEGTGYTYEVVHNTIAILKAKHNLQDRSNETLGSIEKSVPEFGITGKVIDDITQQPLPGVNVVIKGTIRGTVTNNDGKYTIGVEENETLIFTFVGYKTTAVAVSGRSTIDVSLQQDVAQLKEVVVNGGYYETTDKLKTGSIVKVSAKDIENQPVTSPLMALQGRVPGLEITPASGTPGTAPTIRIRGTNSLRAKGVSPEYNGNYPLYVIDGVPIISAPIGSFGGSYTSAGYDPLSTLNPSAIESIEVLKDGDATAIYGSRGANGVILITTKLGAKSSERTNFEITSYLGVGRVSKRLDLLNTHQYVAVRREAIANDGLAIGPLDSDLNLWDTTRYTDWQKILLGGTANISDFQGALSTSNEKTSFRFNGGYHKETLVFPGDFNYQRASAQLSVNHKSIDNKFTTSISASYGLDNNHLFNDAGGMISAAVSLAPNAPRLYNEDGTLNWETFIANGKMTSSWTNPLSYVLNRQTTKTNNFLTSANFRYEFYKGIDASISAGYTSMNNLEIGIFPSAARQPDNPAQGSANFRETERNSWILEPKLSYARLVGAHSFNILIGSTWQDNSATANLTLASKYPSDALLGSIKGAGVIDINQEDYTVYKYTSLYARVGYTFQQRYILNLTARRDGSSRFGPGNRFGNFGAVGAGWIFSNESFLQNASWFLNFGKIRVSYGKTGSDQIGDYKYFDLYDVTTDRYNGRIGFTPSALLNSHYAWEVTKKLEAAIELGFFENKISIEFDWYRNRSSNQLINYTLPVITGFSSVASNFPATVQNTGLEGVVRVDLLNSDNWRWNLALNLSLPKNKLVRFDNIDDSPYATLYKVGQPLSIQALYTYEGINQETGLYEFVDRNKDGLFNELDKTLQNPNERAFYGGLSSTIQYKLFELALLFQFSNQAASKYYAGVMPGMRNNQPTAVLNRWQQSGDLTDVQRYSTMPTATQRYNLLIGSNYNFVNAGFMRLKTMSIAFRFPPHWVEKTRLQQAKIFCQGQNIFTVTSYPGLDPETGNTLPPLRMITVGFQCSF